MNGKLTKVKSDSKKFWTFIQQNMEDIEHYPAWKKGGRKLEIHFQPTKPNPLHEWLGNYSEDEEDEEIS